MSTYSVRYLITPELSENQWNSYHNSFRKVFDKEYSIEYLKRKYIGSCLGYSFHGALFCDEEIVGMYTEIPRRYHYFDREIIVGQGCDAFILPEHRKDESYLKQIFDVVVAGTRDLEIVYHISIPNRKAYPYWKYYVGCRDIGKLRYYILPVRVGNVLGKWRFLNIISIPVVRLMALIGSKIYRKQKVNSKPISVKRTKEFFSERFGNEYHVRIKSDQSGFVYLIYNEGNICTAYLMDCFPLTQKNISDALKQIIYENGRKIDVIIFVGLIEKMPFYFIKVPRSKEPRQQPFIAFCSDSNPDDLFFDISNWEISLTNFDNR